MRKDILILESWRFTSLSALTREIEALLNNSSYSLEVQVRGSQMEEISNELENWKSGGRLKFITERGIAKERKENKKSQHFEVIDDCFKKFRDGREICLKTRKGREEYRARTRTMAERQHWVCGFSSVGSCHLSDVPMIDVPGFNTSLTFEHADKRGASRQNDSIDPSTKNCAVHALCNNQVGSRRVL